MSHEHGRGPDYVAAAMGAAMGAGAFDGEPLDRRHHDAPPVDEPAEAADHAEGVDSDLGVEDDEV
jgi:hypothetical protein